MINFAQMDYGQEEIEAVNSVLGLPDPKDPTNLYRNFWLASGEQNERFEEEFAEYVGTKYGICVNSGSSANLLALYSLNLTKASKVLTSACGFPATLSPIIHCGLEPVFVDYNINTLNIDVDQVISKIPEVKAIILAHTLGNPVDIERIVAEAKKYSVYVIEDCCEAAGTRIFTKYGLRSVGSFGDIGTFSFYPSHQMTAGGGGGMIVTNDKETMTRCKSLRDWGKTWNWDEKLGDNRTIYTEDMGLGYNYYKHYIYQTVGYNMKLPEMNAAFGRAQLKKLRDFSYKRWLNFERLRHELKNIEEFMPLPDESKNKGFISWFGFPITLRDGVDFTRNDFGNYLESCGIRHRPFFAGNILRHAPFAHPDFDKFPMADKLMKDSLFIGCHTKMTHEDIYYITTKILRYVLSNNTKLQR